MSKYKNILFDLDGTLADTSMGIIDSYKFTLTKMGYYKQIDKLSKTFIGDTPKNVFVKYFGLSNSESLEALKIYREFYRLEGIYNSRLYEGIEDLLMYLKENNFRIGVATLKLEFLASDLLKHLDIASYFDVIAGLDTLMEKNKSIIIEDCLKRLSIEEKSETIFIGDSIYDYIGAQDNGLDFIEIKYGYGLNDANSKQLIKSIGKAYVTSDIKNIIA